VVKSFSKVWFFYIIRIYIIRLDNQNLKIQSSYKYKSLSSISKTRCEIEVDIGSCNKLPDTYICAAATSCPQLVKLDMHNCSCVSDENLREIAHHCPNLGFLDASYCSSIWWCASNCTLAFCICKLVF
jgi:hypothetical protein